MKGDGSSGKRGYKWLEDERESTGDEVGLPEIREKRRNGGPGMPGCAFCCSVVDRDARSESAPIRRVDGLRIEEVDLSRPRSEKRSGLSLVIDGIAHGSTILGFPDGRVDFITQAVCDVPLRRNFPGVLKVKVISVPANGSFIKLVAWRCDARRGGHGVGIRCGGQKSGKCIGQGVARLNIVLAAGGENLDRGIRRATTEGVKPVRVDAKDGGVFIQADVRSPLEGVCSARPSHIDLGLIDISVGTENGAARGVEPFIQAIAEGQGRIGGILRWKNRGAAYIAKGGAKVQAGRECTIVVNCDDALVIEEIYTKTGINRGLVRIRGWTVHLVEAEAAKQSGLVREMMVHADRKLIGIGDDL